MKIGPFGDQRQHITQQLGDLLSQQQRGQQRLQGDLRISAVDALTVWQFVATADLQSSEGLQVVAQHFCRNILLDTKLRQTRGVFQIQTMLEPLERFLDMPALMTEIRKSTGWKACWVEQVRHLHAGPAIRRYVAHQAH